jgi:Flp pilus assembly pilin Flp
MRHALLDHQEVISVLQLRQIRRQEGQTMAEYGVVLAVITAAALGALTLLSTNVGAALTRVAGLVGVGNG